MLKPLATTGASRKTAELAIALMNVGPKNSL
jgi:hypothetical protein